MTKSAAYFRFTEHAKLRCAQRNVSEEVVALVIRHGSAVRDGILMRQKDVIAASNPIRHSLRRLHPRGRLHLEEAGPLLRQLWLLQKAEGVYLPTDASTVITVLRVSPTKCKRILRSLPRRTKHVAT